MRNVLFVLLTFSLTCFLTGTLDAQQLRGTITNSKNGETLIGATAVVKGTTKGASADIDGNFVIDKPGTPPFTLVVSFVGFTSKEIQVKNLDQALKITLSPNEELLKEVEIVDSRLTEKQRESPLTVEAMDLLAIKETPAANFYDGLGSLKGVDLTAASLGFKIINTRGFNSTSPVRSLQIIDGVDNQSPGLNFSLGNFLGSSELDVQKVDIIVGASSAFYGPNAFNGVISMTTKNPFDYTGLSVQTKVGERDLFETAIRYAEKFQNKKGEDKFAYKINMSFMRAYDWVADNMDATEQSVTQSGNPGGYDAVNRYGDEELGGYRNNYTSTPQLKSVYPGLGAIYRTGYQEKDLVDYNTRNIKLNAALHYRLKPDVELILSSNFGTGTTIYQGENRFSLKNILFFQQRLEFTKKDKFFVRVYATNEDAGDSYDAVVSAFEMQNLSKSNNQWKQDYQNSWTAGGFNAPRFIVKGFDGYPSPFNVTTYDSVMAANYDKLVTLHDSVRAKVDRGNGTTTSSFFAPGTARFDSAFAAVKSRTLSNKGSLLKDKSALYHVHAEYKFQFGKFTKLVVGANGRMYRPNSDGTIFSDTLVIDQIVGSDTTYKRRVIVNKEFGAYTGIQRKFFAERLSVNATVRVDKNQNFNWISTQSFSGIYTINNNHTFRAVYSSAVRNPTLADQYLYYNVGRAILLGNIDGKDSLIEITSFFNYLNTLNPNDLRYFNVDPIRPERVKTFEFGYRSTLFKRLFVDASYYLSEYHDFIGYKIGLDVTFTGSVPQIQAYRLAANTNDVVYTQGFSLGMNYYLFDKLELNGNYSYNILNRPNVTDEIITAFNTPMNKYNIGFSGRKIKLPFIKGERFSFNANYKWVQGFRFEGSPQFTGSIPSYGMVDSQISYAVEKWKTVFKLGASNLLDNKVSMVYGGPKVGRLAYFSILVDLTN
ncbi:MAG TPA: TonB-dependent receptor [Flavobacteriales bacterium]|nr:TonB-dependent receptor [Flavobacteriales bacterium]HPH81341.1 TonB-dependent receptor [Flavobacteriales bacterium]